MNATRKFAILAMALAIAPLVQAKEGYYWCRVQVGLDPNATYYYSAVSYDSDWWGNKTAIDVAFSKHVRARYDGRVLGSYCAIADSKRDAQEELDEDVASKRDLVKARTVFTGWSW